MIYELIMGKWDNGQASHGIWCIYGVKEALRTIYPYLRAYTVGAMYSIITIARFSINSNVYLPVTLCMCMSCGAP
jgi:hypothetical protein